MIGQVEAALRDVIDRTDGLYLEDLDWYAFPETWSDTSLGFGGMAGQMITKAQSCVVFINPSRAYVYRGSRLYGEVNRRTAMDMCRLHTTTVKRIEQ